MSGSKSKPISLAKRNRRIHWMLNAISALLLLITFASCFELGIMDNTLKWTKLFVPFSLLGLLVFLGVLWFLTYKSKFKSKGTDLFYGMLFFALVLGLPSGANFYNRKTAVLSQACFLRDVKSMHERHRRKGGSDHYIFAIINDEEERISVSHAAYHEIKGKRTVEVCITKGKLGFDFISKVNAVR